MRTRSSRPGCVPVGALVVALTVPAGASASPELPDALLELPRGYVCFRAEHPPMIDGRLDDAAWATAPWSEPFVDIEGDRRPAPRFKTRFKMLWDDAHLFVGAFLEEPHVRARVTERDTVIHRVDSNFEVFIDPDGDGTEYMELQTNAAGAIFDLLLPKSYRNGGSALFNWDAKGVRLATHVDGTPNDPTDVDEGWWVEMAIPWEPTVADFGHTPVPPREGDRWRMNFSRVEWPDRVLGDRYVRPAGHPEANWTWSPQGVVDMHRPETWGVVEFHGRRSGDEMPRPVDPAQAARAILYGIHHAQRAFHESHGRWARELSELGLGEAELLELGGSVARLDPRIAAPAGGSLELGVTGSAFEARVEIRPQPGADGTVPDARRWHVRQDGRLWRSR